jgi:hypothetical protein
VEAKKCGCVVDYGPINCEGKRTSDPIYLKKCRDHKVIYSSSGKIKPLNMKEYTIEEEIALEHGEALNKGV